MTNEELIEGLDELFNLVAILDSELMFSNLELDGNEGVLVESGWSEIQALLYLLNDLSPHLAVVQTLLAENITEPGEDWIEDEDDDFEDDEDEPLW
jgi:hypothetical protein